jgi:uncharacterized membrane protein
MQPTFAVDEWHLVSLAPWGRVGAVLAIAVAVVVFALAYRALAREERAWRRWLLLVLRAGAIAAALVLFFQPAIRKENVTRVPNHVAVLVDASESMRLGEKPNEPTRAERAARLIARERATFEALRGDHRVDFFTFGDKLAPTTEDALARAPSPPPREPATRLREALGQLRTRYEGRDLAGVIVVSDGIDNGRLGQGAGAGLDAESTDFLKSLDAPVHTAWVGRAGLHDVAITRVLADDFAFVRTAVQIEAVLRVVGADESGWVGRTLPVTLREGGVPVRTVPITVERGRTDYHVAFAFTPERVGKYVYEISTPVLSGEAIAENNARTFLLKIIRDKIRVLQVAGRPSWDERFLRGLLKHDPNVDLISFFILRTPTDLESVPSEELSLIPFPTEELFQEQLRSFDVVFVQNFNYGPYGIGAYLGEIKRYVDEGGGLAMIGGDLAYSSGGWAHTPVAEVLPIDLLDDSGLAPERLIDASPFKLALTPEGQNHPVTALRVDLKQNAERWAGLPDLEGTNLIARARPGATVLGVHPVRRGTDGKPLPVLTVGEAGKGRVLTFTSDSSWRWGFVGGAGGSVAAEDRGRTYQRFWENAIRWLIRDPSLSFLRIETDQQEYARGSRIGIDVRALGTDYRPLPGADVTVTVTRLAGERPEPLASKSGRTDEDGELRVELEPLAPGGYRVIARATLGGRPTEERDVFVVRGAGRELEEPEARENVLQLVSAASGGTFKSYESSLAGLAFHPPRVIKVNRHQDVELWNRWWVLLVAAGCLSANWVLRRRWGYA